MKSEITPQQRHALQAFRSRMHDLSLADREYTRAAGENIRGYFFAILSLVPTTVFHPFKGCWHSTLEWGPTKGERHAVKEWPRAALEIAEKELKFAVDGLGRSATDRIIRHEWKLELRRELTAYEKKLLPLPPAEQRYKLYFSRKPQLEREHERKSAKVVRLQQSPQVLGLLDNGEIVEFTEPIFLEPHVEQAWRCTVDHWERYDDSVELGDGVMVVVEPYSGDGEKGLRLVRLLDNVR